MRAIQARRGKKGCPTKEKLYSQKDMGEKEACCRRDDTFHGKANNRWKNSYFDKKGEKRNTINGKTGFGLKGKSGTAHRGYQKKHRTGERSEENVDRKKGRDLLGGTLPFEGQVLRGPRVTARLEKKKKNSHSFGAGDKQPSVRSNPLKNNMKALNLPRCSKKPRPGVQSR